MKLPEVSSQRGAPMGRSEKQASDSKAVMKFSLTRIRLNSGGYDNGGAYWGIGARLYLAQQADLPPHETKLSDLVTRYFRAANRDAAKGVVKKEYPNATFYR